MILTLNRYCTWTRFSDTLILIPQPPLYLDLIPALPLVTYILLLYPDFDYCLFLNCSIPATVKDPILHPNFATCLTLTIPEPLYQPRT